MTTLAETPTYVAPSGVLSALWLLLLIPFVGAAVLLLGGRRTNPWGHVVGTLVSGASFVVGVLMFYALLGRDVADRSVSQHLYSWIPVGGFQVDLGILFDPLSAVFVLLITGVGTLVHVYSIGYMGHDPERRRFFAYLNLFLGSMLLLVLSNSFLTLYVGWELVGLSSYLLIAFWFWKPEAATAGKKAFIVNRVGDVGLSLAIMLMFATFGTVSFQGVFGAVGGAQSGTVTAIALLLVLGAVGKSAQFPLQTWLADAMEGPTPASALIHAATMVTAGVYLIARANPIFDLTQTGQLVAASVGVATILIGAVIGCAHDDIKRVLAYSTISQIGYMFLGVGLGPAGYALGILHLLTHGFFKAGLFMGAGSVMHAMDDQTDMRRFGGLRTAMPVTFVTFFLGYLAIIGVPPFSGFFSKDAIIEAAFDKGGGSGWTLGILALAGAGITAFYMSRLVFLTFFGPRRWTERVHPHEAPFSMTLPMVLLAIGSVGAGFFLRYMAVLQDWLAPVLGRPAENGLHTVNPSVLTALTLVVVVLGIGTAWAMYLRREAPLTAPAAVTPFTLAARNRLYADAFNEAVLMRPGQYLTRALVFLDGKGVDGLVNGLAAFVGGSSGRLRRLQTGFVRSYALSMFGGAAVVVAALLLVGTNK